MRRKLGSLGFSSQRYVYPPGTVFPGHTHAQDKMDGVLSGLFCVVVAGREYKLGPGDMVFVPHGTVHSAEVIGDEPVVSLDGSRS